MLREAEIGQESLRNLELRNMIAQAADDLFGMVSGTLDAEAAGARYPGW